MIRAHKIWTPTCRGCDAWVRVTNHPLTNQPIVQELHEDNCHVWPKQQRRDGR
jgi:hypothetical protein